MPKNAKACEKKVEAAVNAIMRFTGMKVREAMGFVLFLKKEIDDVNVQCVVECWLFRAMQAATPTPTVHKEDETLIDLPSLSSDNGSVRVATTMAIPVATIIPPQKCKMQRMTACALEKKCIKDMKQKKHRSNEH